MPNKVNPFKAQIRAAQQQEKDEARDPLDVRELLTEGGRKAIITPDGELKLQGQGSRAGVELMKERYWGGEFGLLSQKQIALESRLMKDRFPKFELQRAAQEYRRHGWVLAEANRLYWSGTLSTYGGARYLVAAVYPADYPFGEIRAYVVEPLLPVTEHRFQDGHLCLYDHDDNGRGFESGKTTAVTVIAWTAAWLHAYEIWRTTGKWPSWEDAK